MTLYEKLFENIMGKGENAGYQQFLSSNVFCPSQDKFQIPFPTMFSTLPKANFSFWVRFILSSANLFNLTRAKILSSGKGLRLFQIDSTFMYRQQVKY